MIMVEKLIGLFPEIIITPGETIKEKLLDLGMTQVEFAKRMKMTEKHISMLLNGKAPITHETAVKLENVLGIPAYFWINLEANYRAKLERLKQLENIKKDISILKYIPYNEMSNFGWVPKVKKPEEKINVLQKFFGISELSCIKELLPALFRKSQKYEASAYALAAWLRKAELEAYKISTLPFDKRKLTSLIPEIRSFSNQDPKIFLPKLKELLASCGIAFVLLPHLSKTHVQGAVKWLKHDKVLLALTIRYKYADIFWFSFFHEIGHILNGSKKEIYITGEDLTDKNTEKEADTFASNILIPEKEFQKFISNKNNYLNAVNIKNFAHKIGIHPGIVVGRLQHEKLIDYKMHNNLRVKYEWAN